MTTCIVGQWSSAGAGKLNHSASTFAPTLRVQGAHEGGCSNRCQHPHSCTLPSSHFPPRSLHSFTPGSGLAADMAEVQRRYGYSTVRLVLTFHQGLHPFYPCAVEITRPHLKCVAAVLTHLPSVNRRQWLVYHVLFCCCYGMECFRSCSNSPYVSACVPRCVPACVANCVPTCIPHPRSGDTQHAKHI